MELVSLVIAPVWEGTASFNWPTLTKLYLVIDLMYVILRSLFPSDENLLTFGTGWSLPLIITISPVSRFVFPMPHDQAR